MATFDSVQSPPPATFWGPDPVPLQQRFAAIKRSLIAGHETELETCWARLIDALRVEVEHVELLGAHLVPSIEFADLADPAQTSRFGRDLRRYGVGVVRKVFPRRDAEASALDTIRYLDSRRPRGGGVATGPSEAGVAAPRQANARPHARSHSHSHFRAPRQDPTCLDCFWTPAQVRARAHPNVLYAQRFMMSLWGPVADKRFATHLPIAYVDRIRIHGGGFGPESTGGFNANDTNAAASNASPPPANMAFSPPQQNPQSFFANQSADDWINALQSSAGIIAQVDNGSLERWEPDGYGRSGTYDRIFHGRWEDYDPWECSSRVNSTMDLYNGYGACTIFRMFQGLLALSTIEPGMLRLFPSPKLVTAYYLLRPFFTPRTPAPASRTGPEWDAYLAASNWRLQREPDTIIHGAVPGHAQRVTEHWHPHLCLRSSLVTLPTLQPGDYIFWHPDLPYHISNGAGHGMQTPSGNAAGADEISMLVYIPAAPLTQTNALYLARQRKAFQRGYPGPDFDSAGTGFVAEDPSTRPGESEMEFVGGIDGLRAMGLARWNTDDVKDEVAGLANSILFPE
ncbi:hypothetical protein RJ55_03876 [Drechmeria coniospora]|nr:hypothetical protein RJ55_03876 [Drechmeria coniospora]